MIEKVNRKITGPIANLIKDTYVITPDRVTWSSFIMSGVIAPVMVVFKYYVGAALFFYLGALLDSLDGELARVRGIASKAGALLDAVLDRYSDAAMLLALSLVSWSLLTGFFAMLGSFVTPYIRAKGEALGIKKFRNTIGSRDIRCAVISLMLFLQKPYWALVIVAVISNISALDRFLYAYRKLIDVK
ncbi:MAG: CDP-alcohol phosphatidyltransferase family protein [Candidatus Nanohaloarchaeota archaeon]|nr:CDP-alcohol phosphatidyltransferase family protein [Candidatus Nanohaloarchaeota archaeon]